MPKSQSNFLSAIKGLSFAIALNSTAIAHALRTAVFAEEIRNRAAIWLEQDKIFAQERTSTEQQRPIWIHAGDSIATGWANGGSLREKLQVAQTQELPEAGSVRDIFEHIPQASKTWYSGSHVEGSVFQSIERATQQSWVLLSTALAGAMLSQINQNPLRLPLEIRNPERVQLITVSVGGNDLCALQDPYSNLTTDPEHALSALKARFPNAKLIAFAPPSVTHIYQSLRLELSALAHSVGKSRIEAYCKKTWEQDRCPKAGLDYQARSEQLRQKILHTLHQSGAQIVDLSDALKHWPLVEALSSDCFHPSLKAQEIIAQEVFKVYR